MLKTQIHNPAAVERTARLVQIGRVAAAWLLLATSAFAQSAPVSGESATVAAAARRAREWVTRPTTEKRLAEYSPAAEICERVYDKPRPLKVWLARVDLSVPGVRFAVTKPAVKNNTGETLCATTLDFAKQRGVQLAFNASAFSPFRPKQGEPMDVVGLAAVDGKQYSDPDDRFGAVYISRDGRVALKGPPLPLENLWHVVPGFRLLVDDRRIAIAERVANSKFGGVNPRTAVGVDREGRLLWIAVVDGRQPGVSEGITLVELACLFQSLDVWDAINLDGGGSSTFVLENADGLHYIANTPVGRGRPNTLRQVGNNIGLYLPRTSAAPPASHP